MLNITSLIDTNQVFLKPREDQPSIRRSAQWLIDHRDDILATRAIKDVALGWMVVTAFECVGDMKPWLKEGYLPDICQYDINYSPTIVSEDYKNEYAKRMVDSLLKA
jgi:hypothetical protein